MVMENASGKKVKVPADVLATLLDGESVLLDLKSELYFGLDEIGTRVWEELTSTGSVEAAFRSVLSEYDVEPERLRQDIDDLIGRLVEHGLVEIVDE